MRKLIVLCAMISAAAYGQKHTKEQPTPPIGAFVIGEGITPITLTGGEAATSTSTDFEVYTIARYQPVLHCDLVDGHTKNCALAQGASLDDVVDSMYQSSQQSLNYLTDELQNSFKHSQACLTLAERENTALHRCATALHKAADGLTDIGKHMQEAKANGK